MPTVMVPLKFDHKADNINRDHIKWLPLYLNITKLIVEK
jgi:hypothetical protein